MDVQAKTNKLYNEQNKLYDAIEVINQYEEGDQLKLKQAIRKRIQEIDDEVDGLELGFRMKTHTREFA